MRRNRLLAVFIVLGLGIMMFLAACGSSTPAATTTTSGTTTPPVTTTSSTTSPTTTTSQLPTATTTTTSTTPPVTTTTSTTLPTTTTTTTTATATSSDTFQALASAGQAPYNATCALCHGKNGGGSQVCPVTIWGSGSELGTYNGVTLFTDAAGMLDYISNKMPLTTPGSLSAKEYNELLAYILVKGSVVTPATAFDTNTLSSISIP